mgnify:CR=1 FL=1
MPMILPRPRPDIGDLVKSKASHVLGMVVEKRPEEVVGAGWIPERFVVWWLNDGKSTTEFVGTEGLDFIQVVSKAKGNEEN